MNLKIKKWKVGDVRIRRAKGDYSFYCSCGKYKTIQKGDRLKVTKGKNGYIYKYRCPDTRVNVVLERM